MKLLAFDTTEEGCSAALLIGGETVERFEHAPRRHSELLLPMMDALLADAALPLSGLDALAFARGPGAFTGLRIAASVAQGAALGADLPVVPVSSLQALAQGVVDTYAVDAVLTAFDARMGEVYWGTWRRDDSGTVRAVGDEAVIAPAAATIPEPGNWCGAGSGWRAHRASLLAASGTIATVFDDAVVHAAAVARLGATLLTEGVFVDAAQALPVYLRNQVAWAKP